MITAPIDTISADYRNLNQRLHMERGDYGAKGKVWAPLILPIIQQYRVNSVLDYGCGKGSFKMALNEIAPTIKVDNYDPCIIDFSIKPEMKYDLIVCTDVMEHVEIEYTDAVLTDISRYSNALVFFNVATSLASKTLPDGRNTHVNLHSENWWIRKLMEYWDALAVARMSGSGDEERYRAVNFLGISYGVKV